MIFGIPRTPLFLALAGLIPIVWGAVTVVHPPSLAWGIENLGSRFVGPYIQLFYGTIILSFMSGVLWGFATKQSTNSGYVLSVIPALWAFFMTGGGATAATINLIVGFLAVLSLDWHFWSHGQTPSWWLRLRIIMTALVVICLLPGVFI